MVRRDAFTQKIMRACDLIREADGLVIAAGAGMGVDSGLPDFRGEEGFWRAYPALRVMGIDFQTIASPRTFEHDPRLAWGFYGHRLNLYRQKKPHAGFDILRALGAELKQGCTVFTSNVDGHFQRAGFESSPLQECHGSIHHMQCLNGCCDGIWPAVAFEPEVDLNTCRLLNELPQCPNCAGLARPNILMFNDPSWLSSRSADQRERQRTWLRSVRKPVVIELGAGTTVPSVRMFTRYVTTQLGGRLIRINPREAIVESAQHVSLTVGALAGLQWIKECRDEDRN